MKFLSSIFNFNSPKTMPVSRRQLAELVAPLMPKGGGLGNEALAKGWEETAEWLRIGFDSETDKGSLYHALHTALRRIADSIRSTPENSLTVEVEKRYLEAIRASFHQFGEASHNLDLNSRIAANTPPQIVEDRHGNRLEVPVIQIYNRPYEPHDLAGMKLEDIQENFEKFFAGADIKPASNRQIDSYIPKRHY